MHIIWYRHFGIMAAHHYVGAMFVGLKCNAAIAVFRHDCRHRKEPQPEATATLNQASIRQQLGVTHRTVADCEKVPLQKILVRAIPDISYGN
jgi:predicted kinase